MERYENKTRGTVRGIQMSVHSGWNYLWTTPLTKMTTDTRDSEPVSQKPYPIAMKHYHWVKGKINKLLTAKVIRSSQSSWSAPIIVVPKGDGGKHLGIDYCALKNITQTFSRTTLKVEDILYNWEAWNTSQPWIYEQDNTTCHWMGHQYPKQPSLYHSDNMNTSKYPSDSYKHLHIFRKSWQVSWRISLCYCLLGWYNHLQQDSRGTPRQHQAGFQKLWIANLSMKLSKCHFLTKEIQYLGHILSTTDIRPLPLKTQAINDMHPPKTAKQVCAFLGLVRYYRKFMKDFAKMAKPLTLLPHHKAMFEWTPVHHTTFMILKEAIIQSPILCYPDPTRKYLVYMDALDNAWDMMELNFQ